MKQYLLSIYQPDGDSAAAGVPRADHGEPGTSSTTSCGPPARGCSRAGCTRPSTATVVRVRDGELLLTDGPFTEGKEHIGGFTVINAPRPRRGAGLGAAGSRRRPRCRSRCGRSRAGRATDRMTGRRARSSAPSTAARSPCWSASSATSTSPRRPCRTRSPTALARWPASGLPPSPAGWIITTARNRAIDRLRREASRGRPARAGGRCCAPRDRAGRGGRRARRPAAADLHLLPSGARARPPRSRSPCGCSAA